MWVTLGSQNHWNYLSVLVLISILWASSNALPLPLRCLFPHSRVSGLPNPAALLPSWGPHSKELPNSKLKLLRNGLGWGLSRGASLTSKNTFFP